jgi:hypothetical protein
MLAKAGNNEKATSFHKDGDLVRKGSSEGLAAS